MYTFVEARPRKFLPAVYGLRIANLYTEAKTPWRKISISQIALY